jgi:predicted dithiol-disulfide oxidoreductase (DUF899 family)
MPDERCPDCGETFQSLDALNEHRLAANHQALPPDEKHPCNECEFIMETVEELQRHKEMVHGAATHTPPSDRR